MAGTDAWELMKKEIKRVAVQKSKKIASETRIVISQLNEYIIGMEEQLETLTEEDKHLLHTSKAELDEILEEKAKGAIFRSKAKWYMEGEKNTKYFFGLERANYNAKTCHSVFINPNDEEPTTDPKMILKAQQDYYQTLYTANPQVSFQLEDKIQIQNRVNEQSAAANEDQFTETEIIDAIKSLKNGSCPGSDGLPVEVYKMFWPQIRSTFMRMIEDSFQKEEIHRTARKGILNLIPKGQKDSRYLKNLRPITLLNTDYKIIEKSIANRMVPELCEIVNKDQTGFLPGRRISTNIRKILDFAVSSHLEDTPQIIMSCDYQKCFDMIEFEAITKSMQMFGFSKILTKMDRDTI